MNKTIFIPLHILMWTNTTLKQFSSIFRQQRQEAGGGEGAGGSGPLEGEALISRVNKAVTAITARIQALAASDGADSKV